MIDGHALYTPGLSENRCGTSLFYDFDRLGNLWTLDGTTKNQLGYVDFSGFGGVIASVGSTSPFSFGGRNGCQTDPDASLILMGHRYYDPRTGRFISQDPAGSGDNWYVYADNNPVNKTDPLGLWINSPIPENGTPSDTKLITDAVQGGAQPGEQYDLRRGSSTGEVIKTFTIPGGSVLSWNGFHILVPPGVSIDRNIAAARGFMSSDASKSVYHYGWHGTNTGQKYDVNKITAWLIGNVDTGRGQDYKTGGVVYDASGHVNYAAVATQLGFDMESIILGQQYVHLVAHGLGSGLEGTGYETLGHQYDEQVGNPGAALWDAADSASAFVHNRTGL